ncbi:TetR/AcrR family transcriptional regulator [Streptomyces sp. NPDC050560]|uniref:TetR/AcrR family transcriptional regulator n=1 Tax=Streptomyces sp. NPDC050560 TaxID=3365630 RepID=UPI0037A82A49
MTDPARAPLRADARRNRERILAAAAEVFATRGLAATLHDVAAHAGVGVGTVYRRFPDKRALIAALFDTKIEELVSTAERAAAIEDPWQALTALLRDLTLHASSDSGLRQVLGNEAPGPDKFVAARRRLAVVASRLLVRAKEAGVVRADLEYVDLAMLWRMLTHVAEQTRGVRGDAWERYLEIVLEGIRGREGQRGLGVVVLGAGEVPLVLGGS